MERTSDPAVVNAIMGDLFGEPIDFTAQMGEGSYALVGEHGCMLFEPGKAPGGYTLTMGIREEGRGAWATSFVDTCLRWMFENTDAEKLWACVLSTRRDVLMLAAQATGIEIEHARTHSFASVTKERWSNAHAQVA
jgi:hypothetical protein